MQKKCITNFSIQRPKYEISQVESLNWIHDSHLQSERLKNPEHSFESLETFSTSLKNRIRHVCCKADIEFRGHELSDFFHTRWNEMSVYRLSESIEGIGLAKRQELHREYVDAVFETFYQEEKKPPNEILHVSCTGYVSPSGAQKLISKKGWSGKTSVTHLYHMGCYAAIPAIKLASALVEKDSVVDVVHTELCTLHHNPSNHEPESLVAQSLFADGYIKYSLVEEENAKALSMPYLVMHATYEEIIPGSSHAMEWILTESGFRFILEKEIPLFIASSLLNYIEALCKKAGISKELLLKEGHVAVHPGGPKIIQYTQKLLNLQNHQLSTSREILRKYGNMSSATLPHMWDSILKNPEIVDGTYILSIAFGPGLTIAGTILQKKGQF